MGKQLGLIIFLLFIVSQVVRAIMDRANKSRQEQQLHEAAAQRRQQMASRGASPSMTEAPDRAAELAARRRTQLQELRRRAATTSIGSQPGPLRTPVRPPTRPPTLSPTRTPTRTPAGGPRRTPTNPFGLPPQVRQPPQRRGVPGPPAATPAGPMARPPRVAPRPAPPPTVSTTVAQAKQREELLAAVAARKRDEEMRALKAPRRLKPPTEQEQAYDIRSKQRHPLFRGERRTPELLRKMVVLKELLEPPVALREQQAWERQ